MHLIEKQNAALRRLERARPIADRAGKGALHIAEQVGGQQFGIAGVLSAVEVDKGRVGRDHLLRDGVLMQQLRHIAFAGAAVAGDQQRQSAVGIEQRGFQLLDRFLQAAVMADQQRKMVGGGRAIPLLR